MRSAEQSILVTLVSSHLPYNYTPTIMYLKDTVVDLHLLVKGFRDWVYVFEKSSLCSSHLLDSPGTRLWYNIVWGYIRDLLRLNRSGR